MVLGTPFVRSLHVDSSLAMWGLWSSLHREAQAGGDPASPSIMVDSRLIREEGEPLSFTSLVQKEKHIHSEPLQEAPGLEY